MSGRVLIETVDISYSYVSQTTLNLEHNSVVSLAKMMLREKR